MRADLGLEYSSPLYVFVNRTLSLEIRSPPRTSTCP